MNRRFQVSGISGMLVCLHLYMKRAGTPLPPPLPDTFLIRPLRHNIVYLANRHPSATGCYENGALFHYQIPKTVRSSTEGQQGSLVNAYIIFHVSSGSHYVCYATQGYPTAQIFFISLSLLVVPMCLSQAVNARFIVIQSIPISVSHSPLLLSLSSSFSPYLISLSQSPK